MISRELGSSPRTVVAAGGRTIERSELITPGPALALAGLLGLPVPDLAAGAGLPLLWHWVYLLDRPAQADLGPDGHPTAGIPAPPGPGRQRLFAGGRVYASGAIRSGELASRRTFVRSTRETDGRSGRLAFVTVASEIRQAGRLVVAEEQDIVYRDAVPATGQAAQRLPAGGDTSAPELPVTGQEWQVTVDPVLLFRFSALTYNGHRIHYDRTYAREVEGHPGLLVHGPLQALIMAEAGRRLVPAPATPALFAYRLVGPLFDNQGLTATADRDGKNIKTTIRDNAGRVTATGTLHQSDGDS